MQFEIDQARFLSAVQLAATVANSRAGMPILANVLIVADGDTIKLSSTDMSISLTEVVACKVGKKGSVTVGVKHLSNVLRTLPAGTVTVVGLDNSWIKITAARSEFKIMGLPEVNFPELPDASNVVFDDVNGPALSEMIGRVAFSVSTDDSRVNLNGALIEPGATLTMVSTDGHRLTKYAAPMYGLASPKPIIVPRQGLAEMRKVLGLGGSFGVAVSDGYLFLRAESVTLAVKLTNATFPPWQQVVPEDYQRRVEVSRADLMTALGQAVVVAPEKTSTVKITIKPGIMALHADNPELGSINLDLPVEFDGVEMTAGFNGAYIREALGVMTSDMVALEFQGELDPLTIRPISDDGEAPEFIAVVMPMRI